MATDIPAVDAARRLGVGEITLKAWSGKLGLGRPGDGPDWTFTERELETLALVQALRAEDRSFDTITRQIRDVRMRPQMPPSAPVATARIPWAAVVPVIGSSGERIRVAGDGPEWAARYESLMRLQHELAESYGRASRRVGELEVENRHLQQRLDEKEALLELAKQDETASQAQIRAHDAEYFRMVADLQAQLAAERAKPWWRKLWG